MKGVHSLALVGLVAASAAHAEWQEVSEANDGSFYTAVASSNIDENELAIYFDPDNQCEPTATIFDVYNDLDREDRRLFRRVSGETLDGTMESKIDRTFSGEAGAVKGVYYDEESEFGAITYRFQLSPQYVADLENGDQVKFRFTQDGEEYEQIVRYPLDGSKWRLSQARNRCEAAYQGGWYDEFESAGEVW